MTKGLKSAELHLIVLWQTARIAEEKILADIKTKLEIVATGILSWPGDAEPCFGEFYGANLPEAKGKVMECGEGAFRYVVVRDNNPVYDYEDTSRGLERVNKNLFALKNLYRAWTGGGHKVHTTNSPEEFCRDIKLLTNHAAEEWEKGLPEGELKVLPGHDGWASLRELFAFLDQLIPYVVLRNAEMLPDGFDPSVHGDIDLLVPDAVQCASLLGAKKVFPEPHRVHYEVMVAGEPVRFDFRYIGDDYYCRGWEEAMLRNRRNVNGVNLLSPEDAFYALVYHALYQKKAIAVDYHEKAAAMAKDAGIEGENYDAWLLELEKFLKRNGYEVTKCVDETVLFNEENVHWRKLAAEIEACGPFSEVVPYCLDSIQPYNVLRSRFFRGKYEGEPCFIKYYPTIGNYAREEWRIPQKLLESGCDLVAKPLFWHKLRSGGSIIATEFIEGSSLHSLLSEGKLDKGVADNIATQIGKLATDLRASGIVHRDIRPQNLFVDKNGKLKLIDFQFAIPAGGEELIYNELALGHHYLPTRILMALGEEYALGVGRWNDDYSLLKCLENFPKTEKVAELKAELSTHAAMPKHCGLGPKKELKRLKKRLRKLKFKRLLAKCGINKRKYKKFYREDLELVESIVFAWEAALV